MDTTTYFKPFLHHTLFKRPTYFEWSLLSQQSPRLFFFRLLFQTPTTGQTFFQTLYPLQLVPPSLPRKWKLKWKNNSKNWWQQSELRCWEWQMARTAQHRVLKTYLSKITAHPHMAAAAISQFTHIRIYPLCIMLLFTIYKWQMTNVNNSIIYTKTEQCITPQHSYHYNTAQMLHGHKKKSVTRCAKWPCISTRVPQTMPLQSNPPTQIHRRH